MYLSELNQAEGKKFLELVYKIANYDAQYQADEIQLLKKFKRELGLEFVPAESTIDELVAYFVDASVQTQKIVYFEIVGMLLADAQVSEKEKEILTRLEAELKITEEEATAIKEAAEKLEEAFQAANAAVK